MTVTCPSCKASLTIPDERLPKGKVITAPCPRCKGNIVIDTTGPPAAAPEPREARPAPAAEVPPAPGDRGLPTALVCLAAPAERAQALGALREAGYAPEVSPDAGEALRQLRFSAHAAVLLQDGFGASGEDGNPVLHALADMGMAARRNLLVVLLSAAVPARDPAAAFARSVDLVLAPQDLPHLTDALKRAAAEREQTYRVLRESLRAVGKG